MISVDDEIDSLKKQENQLHSSLNNLLLQRSKLKEYKLLQKELEAVRLQSKSLQAWAVFEVGMPVHRSNSKSLGIIKWKNTTPGGMKEVWVSWDGTIEIPDSPNLLEIDEFALAKVIAVGDRIIIVDGHEQAGETFTVERLLARGAVETTTEQIFEREEWQKVDSSIFSEGDEELIHSAIFNQEILMDNPPIEEVEERTPETTLKITATVQLEELTEDEEKERHRLELKVELGFREAIVALKNLRDKKLYRSTYRTFEEYVVNRFGMQRAHAYRLVNAAVVVENLSPIGDKFSTTESQCREVAKLPTANQQREAWRQLLNSTGGKVPSAKEVKGIVERLKEKPLTLASNFCTVGDPFILTRLEGAERKYNGCWAIASDVRDFTVVVDVYDRALTVKPENLNPIDLPDVRRQLPETLKRIKRLRNNAEMLDRGVYHALEGLGRQIYLTDFEDKLLTFMEHCYGIND